MSSESIVAVCLVVTVENVADKHNFLIKHPFFVRDLVQHDCPYAVSDLLLHRYKQQPIAATSLKHRRRHLFPGGSLKEVSVCCFITCSCFMDGDLKAPSPPYDFDGEGPSRAGGDNAFRTDQRRYEVSESEPIKVPFWNPESTGE